jgi:hypothetical protein
MAVAGLFSGGLALALHQRRQSQVLPDGLE